MAATARGADISADVSGLFTQTCGPLLAVLGDWVGFCIYAAGTQGANHADPALCQTTIALVDVLQIDMPQQALSTAVAR
ncbi:MULTISPECIES: hypothetical protein [unclassified Bradyrhizobium]|uniref:hypothetical protein n=1 Tax=unclassified Bradyrhizobium TaxID=2631580 RepID=UPI0028E8266D|nr:MULTISPECIES: hypothetical protein [unclassified Bradyrhizobium]